MRIGIVGAGISGLATAFWLQRARPDWPLTVFEAAPEPGGALHTDVVEGFRFEAGCNGFLTNKPDSLELVHESGADAMLMESSAAARKRFVYTGVLQPLPESPRAFLGTRLLTLGGKLRVAAELLVPARRDGADETLEEFGYRRLGREFTDVFLGAMTAGIYGSTPARLSVGAAFPLIAALERDHGGLFRGMLAKRKRQAGPGGVLTSFRGGVGSFITHLARSVRADWRLGTAVETIGRAGAHYRIGAGGTVTEVDRVVVATPAYTAARQLAGLDAALAAELARIEYSPIAVVGFGYRGLAEPLDGFGLLTTAAARSPLLGVLWDSSIFPDRAPPGGKILRAMLGGQRNPELARLDDGALVERTRAGIRACMGVDATPDVVYLRRWERGIPNYGPGHLARVAAVDAAVARHPGLALIGNAYHGVAMNDCCRNSRALAVQLAGDAA
ncbi:MAG TPA: protoporphyrinogen oxidase [Steroidobacteraceae bacterium]|nr:protoporphyrinogen oxidase [Steroidobacteraceae bacterium]